MRKLIIFCLLFVAINLQAQNTVSLTFQPIDRGIGLKYDHYFESWTNCDGGVGLYVSTARGNYRLDRDYIKGHTRIAGGVSTPLQFARISAGLVYHRFGEMNGDFSDRVTDPVSFELGVSVRSRLFCLGLRYDFLKNESCIDIGINFH